MPALPSSPRLFVSWWHWCEKQARRIREQFRAKGQWITSKETFKRVPWLICQGEDKNRRKISKLRPKTLKVLPTAGLAGLLLPTSAVGLSCSLLRVSREIHLASIFIRLLHAVQMLMRIFISRSKLKSWTLRSVFYFLCCRISLLILLSLWKFERSKFVYIMQIKLHPENAD